MIQNAPFWRAGRPLSRPFTQYASLLTYLLVVLGMLAVTLFTLFTKGHPVTCFDNQMLSTDPILQDNATTASCQSTIVYPGQTFSTPDTLFVYEVMSLGNYTKPYTLDDCKILDGSLISSLNFPSSTPQTKYNMTFICTSTQSPISEQTVSMYGGEAIGYNTFVLSIQTFKSSNHSDEYYFPLRQAGIQFKNTEGCNGSPILGFEIYGTENPLRVAYMADDEAAIACQNNISRPNDTLQLADFFKKTISYAQDDFKNYLSPLPNVVFNCPICARQWQPFPSLLWNVLVALGSTWSILLTVATLVVGQRTKSYDSVFQMNSQIDEKTKEDKGLDSPFLPPKFDRWSPSGRAHFGYRSS